MRIKTENWMKNLNNAERNTVRALPAQNKQSIANKLDELKSRAVYHIDHTNLDILIAKIEDAIKNGS